MRHEKSNAHIHTDRSYHFSNPSKPQRRQERRTQRREKQLTREEILQEVHAMFTMEDL